MPATRRNLFISALAFGLSTSFLQSSVYAETTVESLRKAGVIRHGIANDAPHGYMDSSGQTVGYEVEILRNVVQKLGIPKVEFVVTTFGALIPGVKAERFDVASDGMYIRAERCKQVRFTDPHIMFAEGAVVRKGNPKKVGGVEDLIKDPSIRIGVTMGGAQQKTFLMGGGKPEQLRDYPDRATLVAALKTGRIDVALLTATGAMGMYEFAKDEDFELVENFKPLYKDGKPLVSYAAFAFRPEDKQLADAFNSELKAFMKTDEYRAILKRYKVGETMIPPPGATAEAACREFAA